MTVIDEAAEMVEQIDRRSPKARYAVLGSIILLLTGNAGLEGFSMFRQGDSGEALAAVADLSTKLGEQIDDQSSLNGEFQTQIDTVAHSVEKLVGDFTDYMETDNANFLYLSSQMEINELRRDRAQVISSREAVERTIQRMQANAEEVPTIYYNSVRDYNRRIEQIKEEINDIRVRQGLEPL